jgi:hypothetical protein
MTVNEFAVKLAKLEKGKRQIDIAQIKELLSKADKLLDGCIYKLIGWR